MSVFWGKCPPPQFWTKGKCALFLKGNLHPCPFLIVQFAIVALLFFIHPAFYVCFVQSRLGTNLAHDVIGNNVFDSVIRYSNDRYPITG
jgi:hypothetical protein